MYGIIYKATNKNTNKIYIGQTIKTLEERKYHHIYRALNSDISTKFCNSIRKHGERAFLWEILDTAENAIELDEKERMYIAKYSSIESGYNILEGGDCSERDGDLMAIQCGSLPFYAFTLKGELIGEFVNKRSFEREYGVAASHILDMIKNKMYYCNDIIVIDKDKYSEEVLRFRVERAKQKDAFFAIEKATGKNLGVFTNKEECKRVLGLHVNTHITEVLKGSRKSSNGFIFKYVE